MRTKDYRVKPCTHEMIFNFQRADAFFNCQLPKELANWVKRPLKWDQRQVIHQSPRQNIFFWRRIALIQCFLWLTKTWRHAGECSMWESNRNELSEEMSFKALKTCILRQGAHLLLLEGTCSKPQKFSCLNRHVTLWCVPNPYAPIIRDENGWFFAAHGSERHPSGNGWHLGNMK